MDCTIIFFFRNGFIEANVCWTEPMEIGDYDESLKKLRELQVDVTRNQNDVARIMGGDLEDLETI